MTERPACRALLLLACVAAWSEASSPSFANEVLRMQVKGPFVSCDEWLAARASDGPRRLELEALVRGYTEGVAAHISQAPAERSGFSYEDLFRKVDAYCRTYADTLLSAAEITLERQWPSAGDRLTKPGVNGPAPRSAYTFVPSTPKP